MYKKICLLTLVLSIFFTLPFIQPSLGFATEINSTQYSKPNSLSDEEWQSVIPYLMPIEHPLKKNMDAIFETFRVTENSETIIAAGFLKSDPGLYSHAIISKHKKLKGYYFKFYSDEQQVNVESEQWVNRARAARDVQQAIDQHHYQKYFKVAKKWIYLIPESPASKGAYPKHFILVATDLNIEKSKVSRLKWRTQTTPKLLKAVWTLIGQEGLVDSLVAHNLPFTQDNRLALVDLEHHHFWPVPYQRLTHYLNPEMQNYWINLINKPAP